MIRRTLTVALLAICLVVPTMRTAAAQQQQPQVHGSVKDYFDSLIYNPVDTIIDRVDRLIAAAPDDGSRATIAGMAFDYFSTSPLMGVEAVAVHVADEYFLSHKLRWSDDNTFPLLYTYAEFNRSSLIGLPAPELTMKDIDGRNVGIREGDGQLKVLYFYDTQCATCKVETPRLARLASSYNGAPLTIYAIYTQADRDEWQRYVSENFGSTGNDVQVVHLWDPESESSYQIKYGVLSTPTMLLLDSQNTVVGRKLDCNALATLLDVKNEDIKGFEDLFDSLFEALEPVDEQSVAYLADSFAARTEADTALFRDTFYELYKYLRLKQDYECQKGAADIAARYMVGRPEYWSEEFVARMEEALEMFYKNPLGAKAEQVRLINEKDRSVKMLKCGGRYTLLLFHLVQCDACGAELEALRKAAPILSQKGIRPVLVYTGKDERLWKDFLRTMKSDKSLKGWRFLRESEGDGMRTLYDLQYVPKMYLLDKNKIIIAKDIDASALLSLAETL